MDTIMEDDDRNDLQALSFQLEALKEGIFKRDTKIKDLEGRFTDEREQREKLAQLLKLEEQKNQNGTVMIQSFEKKLAESNQLISDLKERLGASSSSENTNDMKTRITAGERLIKDVKNQVDLWKSRCEEMESNLEEEKQKHEQVKFRLSQSEEVLRNFRDGERFVESNGDGGDSDSAKYQNIITGLKASIDVQSGRNIELHQQLQLLKKDSEEAEKLARSLQEESGKDKKLIEELNNQNQREYQRNEKLRSDIQRLKRDIDSWRKIQSDMKSQYQDLRLMYDGVCKHADDQKREMLEMKLLMDRDKRSIARQRDEIDKFKVRVSSLKQTYDDLREKYDETFKLLEDKKVESRSLNSQLQIAKKAATELSTSNKDLKKRSEFSQKELIDKHKLLLQTEDKVKELESILEEKDMVIEEAKTTTKEANDKADKYSQEATTKEKDLMDRIALVQSLQNKIQVLDDDIKILKENKEKLKLALVEKEKVIENKNSETKEKESVVCELEQRIVEMERNTKELENSLDKVNIDLMNKESERSEMEKNIESYVQRLANKEKEMLEISDRMKQMEEETKAIKDEHYKKSDHHTEEKKDLYQQIEQLIAEKDTKEKHIVQLTHDLEEEQGRVHLQNQLLKEVEVKFESEDEKMIEYEEKLEQNDKVIDELKLALEEKHRVMEELKRELEESEIIQVYLKEINALKKGIAEEKSQNDQLQQRLAIHDNEEASRLEDEKKEVMLQMTKELKREKQMNQSIIADLKEDIRVLENNVENENERSNMLSKEVELKERKMNNERESFLQHIEELQDLFSKEKQERCKTQEKLKELDAKLRENERKRLSEIEEFEKNKLQIATETKSNLILDRQEKIEELKQDLQSNKELVHEAEEQLDKANKIHENEKLDLQILNNEKDDLIASLRKENLDLRKGWQKESEWMEENRMDKSSRSLEETRDEIDEATLLTSQNRVIQEIKRKIQVDYSLDQILPLTEQTDEKRLDMLYANSLKTHNNASKQEAILTVFEKLAIVLLLSPLAFFLSCKLSLTLAAVLLPLAFIIHQKPWKSSSDNDRVLNDALDGLSERLAVECAENDNLRQTVDHLKKHNDYRENNRAFVNNNNTDERMQFAEERQLLIKELERQSKEEHEKQKKELLRIQQKQEGDRRRLQRQQALIDKLEIILQEKEIKSRLGQFWGYEELKMAINRLKHEREIEKNRYDCSDDAIIKKRVTGAIDEAASRENSQKREAYSAVAILSGVMMACFSANFSLSFTVACFLVLASCSLVYGIWSWRGVESVKNQLQAEKDVVDAQKAEINELSLLMDKEHDVVHKQKQAIEALERRLNDEYKKNKDHQLTIARLTWVFQESEEMRNISQCANVCSDGKDPELQKLAENHARDKFSVFRSMQKQLEEHSSSTAEQRKVIDDLKNATNVIVHAAEKQISHIKLQKESRLEKDKTLFSKMAKWAMLLVVVASLTIFTAFLYKNKTFALCLPLSFVVIFGVFQFKKYKQRLRENKSLNVKKPSLQLSFSLVKQCGYDILFIAALALLLYNFKSFSFSIALSCFGITVVLRLLTYVLYRRSISNEMTSWNDVVEDLWSQIHERTELIDVQTEEIQTLKKLLEVERSYSRHAERLLKDAKGVNDEGFEELAEVGRLKNRASELDTEEEHLVNYELDEMKIFLEEEQRTNIQLRKTLAEAEEAKRNLTSDLTNLKRKLEMEQIRRKEITVIKEEETLLKDRIEELMEDLEAEQRTKQELNTQLIEERSSRELKQIELQDLKEKIRDEKHANNSLREQVLTLTKNQHESTTSHKELATARHELEEERLATQRHNITLTEAVHKLRELNMDLRRQIADATTTDSECMRQVRDQSEEQQEEIERIQALLEDIANTKKALKYQDLIEELQVRGLIIHRMTNR